jgi:hypothetical protein
MTPLARRSKSCAAAWGSQMWRLPRYTTIAWRSSLTSCLACRRRSSPRCYRNVSSQRSTHAQNSFLTTASLFEDDHKELDDFVEQAKTVKKGRPRPTTKATTSAWRSPRLPIVGLRFAPEEGEAPRSEVALRPDSGDCKVLDAVVRTRLHGSAEQHVYRRQSRERQE